MMNLMADKDSKNGGPFADRRTTIRFPIEQEVSYKILDHRAIAPESGAGKTLDISSGGVLFRDTAAVARRKAGGSVGELAGAIGGGCRSKFVAVGRVVWAEDTRAAMHIEQHEFRTRRTKELPALDPEKLTSARRVPYY